MGKDCGRGNERLDEEALAVYHVAEGDGGDKRHSEKLTVKPSNDQKFNRQPSKRLIFSRQPSI